MYLIKIRIGCKYIYYCQVGHPIPILGHWVLSARGLIQCTSCKDLSWGAGKVPNMVVIMQRAVKSKFWLPLIFQTGHFCTYSPSSLKEKKCLDITIWMSSCRNQPHNPSIPRCFSGFVPLFLPAAPVPPLRLRPGTLGQNQTNPSQPGLASAIQYGVSSAPKIPKIEGKFQDLAVYHEKFERTPKNCHLILAGNSVSTFCRLHEV